MPVRYPSSRAPTAYGDGLWGLRNTDLTDAHGFIITDQLFLLILFDGPWAYRFQTDFFAYQGRVTLSSSLLNEAG